MENLNYKVSRVLKDNSQAVYMYDSKKYYENVKKNHGYHRCVNCGAIIMNLPNKILRHQNTKKCIQYNNKIIN